MPETAIRALRVFTVDYTRANSMSSLVRNVQFEDRSTRFSGADNGSVAASFALLLVVLVGAGGLAVDYSRMVSARTWLQSTLDAAVLAANTKESESAARETFASLIASSVGAGAHGAVTASVDTFEKGKVTASGKLSLPLTLTAIFGKKAVNITATSTAERSNGYQDIYIAIDFSSSLGVAATDADRNALEALTQPYSTPAYGSALPQGCAFGCHRREGWEPNSKTVYQMAREAGIKLREDELVSQFGGLVDLLLDPNDTAVKNGMRQLSVIGFSNYATQLIPPTSSADSIKQAATKFPDDDKFETHFADAFGEFKRLLGTQGDGTQGNPTKTLVLITDGIESRDAFFSQSSIDTSLCRDLKSSNFRIVVVEIKYPNLPLNRLYDDTVRPVQDDISPALAVCASPGWYFQAANNGEVSSKFSELTDKIAVAGLRLTR